MSAVRGGGVCPVRTFCRQGGEGGSSDADVRTFWRKNLGFFEIYGVSAAIKGREGWSSMDILRTRGEGVNFSRFCADVFYGRPLNKIN